MLLSFECIIYINTDYSKGQLGNGYLWDDSEPKVINNLSEVFSVVAGKRHSIALRQLLGVMDTRFFPFDIFLLLKGF